MPRRDPLANPEPLIRSVYAYVAYRIGRGVDAEDVTSDVFEQALRYRQSYDPRKGEPVAWLIGIARRQVARALAQRMPAVGLEEAADTPDSEGKTVERLALRDALATLSDRDRELIALRYGADLPAAQIAGVLDMKTNAVEVALHRALTRLRGLLADEAPPESRPAVVGPGQKRV